MPPCSSHLQWVWKVAEAINDKENSSLTVDIIVYWNNLVDLR